MKITLWFGAAIAAATLSLSASAQAPAGAPAGSNGLCKDGTYSTAAKKSGACSGHKGVQTWYTDAATTSKTAAASTPGPSTPTPRPAPATPPRAATATAPTAAPAPAVPPRATTASAPAPAPAAAPASAPQPAASANRRTPVSQVAAAPGGGPGTVWVNTASKVYHCPGSAYYGKTKAGKYLTEDAAKSEGDRANAGKPCTK